MGIDEQSKVNNMEDLNKKVLMILDEFGRALVEEYIEGREFTVLVCGNEDGKTCTSFKPVEYIFPEGFLIHFLGHKLPNCLYPYNALIPPDYKNTADGLAHKNQMYKNLSALILLVLHWASFWLTNSRHSFQIHISTKLDKRNLKDKSLTLPK